VAEVQADPKVQEVYLGHAATGDATTRMPEPTAVQEA
jgi:urea transport system ATP-binding protein